MGKHWQYLSYIVRHKWYVFLECCKAGIPWRGIVHDLSKFRADEWFPYARYFYGDYPAWSEIPSWVKHSTMVWPRTKEQTEREFDEAWLRHIHRNRHHWQYWILREDSGATKILPMAWRDVTEMICDWRGAGRAQGYGDNTVEWYLDNRDKMQLDTYTREWIEQQLEIGEVAHG